MGAWGSGSFENDTALDLVEQITSAEEVRHALRALMVANFAVGDEEMVAVGFLLNRHAPSLTDDTVAGGRVAAEIVAAALMQPLEPGATPSNPFLAANRLPEKILDWLTPALQENPQLFDDSDRRLALAAMRRIVEAWQLLDSEAAWSSEEFRQECFEQLNDLIGRLEHAAL